MAKNKRTILAEEERETLVAALRERGVDYLTPADAKADRSMDEKTLITHLAGHPDARLRQALIGLFLLNPHLAKYAPLLRSKLPQPAAIELTAFYMAAVYLQQMWLFRFNRYLGSFEKLPTLFKEELCLPDPNEEYGKVGLIALAEWHQSFSGHRFNHLSEYQGVADLVFQSLKMKKRSHESASKG